MRASDAVGWGTSGVRLAAATYWLYFASQKWSGVGWMQGPIQSNPKVEPIPGLQQFMQHVVAPNWHLFAVGQGVAETLVGLLLVLGIRTRLVAAAGTLLALELALTVAFEIQDGGFRWLYYLAVLVNFQLVATGGGPLSLDGLLERLRGPRPLPA